MADFTIMAGTFSVRVNDGHSSETYMVMASSVDGALAEARRRWARRSRLPTLDEAIQPLAIDAMGFVGPVAPHTPSALAVEDEAPASEPEEMP